MTPAQYWLPLRRKLISDGGMAAKGLPMELVKIGYRLVPLPVGNSLKIPAQTIGCTLQSTALRNQTLLTESNLIGVNELLSTRETRPCLPLNLRRISFASCFERLCTVVIAATHRITCSSHVRVDGALPTFRSISSDSSTRWTHSGCWRKLGTG